MTILVEIDAFNKTTKLVETLYYSDRGFLTDPGDSLSNKRFAPRVKALNISRTVSSVSSLVGKSSLDIGGIDLDNHDGNLDFLEDYAFDGRKIIIRHADDPSTAYDSFTLINTSTMKDVLIGESVVKIRVRDKRHRMVRPAQLLKYTGAHIGLHFNGGDSVVDLPIEASPLAGSVWTVEGWFRADRDTQDTTSGTIFKTIYTGGNLTIGVANKVLSTNSGLRVRTGATNNYTNDRKLSDGLKHHIAVVKGATVGAIYLDAILVDTWTLSDITSAGTTSLVRFGAGGSAATPNTHARADLWDWRFWDIEKSAGDILDAYQSFLNGDEAGLIAWYPMNEGVDITIGVTSDPDGDKEFFNPDDYDTVVTLDHSTTPAGTGVGVFSGSLSWKSLLDIKGSSGDFEPLSIGSVFNMAPDLVMRDSQVYKVGSSSVNRITRVREGGNDLLRTGYMSFDGTDDRVNIPDNADYDILSSGALTIEIIISIRDLTGDLRIVQFDNSLSNGSIDIFYSAASTRFFLIIQDDAGISRTFSALHQVIVDLRYHLTIIVDPDNKDVAFYVDGTLRNGTDIPSNAYTFTNTDVIVVGVIASSPAQFLKGIVHQLRVWDDRRSPKEIEQNIFTTLIGIESNLVGYWDFDDRSGTVVKDKSSNANDGTAVGSPVWREPDYTVVNDQSGAAFALKAPPSKPIRCDVEGWLPKGYGVFSPTGSTFDTDKVTVTFDSSLNFAGGTFTIGFWLVGFDKDLQVGPGSVGQMYNTGALQGEWRVRFNGVTNLIFVTVTSSGIDTFTTTFDPQGGTHFVVCTFDTNLSTLEKKIYVDGTLLDEKTHAGTVTNANASDLTMCNGLDGATLSDLFYLDRAMTADEVSKVMFRGISPSDPDLLGWWFVNEDAESTSTTYFDNSNNNNGENDGISAGKVVRSPGPYPTTPSEIIRWMSGIDGVQGSGNGPGFPGVDINTGSFSTYVTDSGDPTVGHLIRDEKVSEVLDLVLSPLGFWSIDQTGKLGLGLALLPDVSGDSSTATFKKSAQTKITRSASDLPSTEVSLLWRHNIDPYNRNELVQSILERPDVVRVLVEGAKVAKINLLEASYLSNPDIQHLLAEPSKPIRTALANLEEVRTAMSQVGGNRSKSRTPYSVETLGLFLETVGNVVTLDESSGEGFVKPRFNFPGDTLDVFVISAQIKLSAGFKLITTLKVVA